MGHVWGRYANRVLMGKPEGNRLLRRSRSRWEDNIKMDIQEMGWENGLDKYNSEQVLLAVFCECGNEPSGSYKIREIF
jgi:hypothetical protein